MSKYGLSPTQQTVLVLMLEGGEVCRQAGEHFITSAGRKIKFGTILALFDQGMINVAISRRRPGLPAKFSAELNAVGERIAKDIRRKPTARERSRCTIESALA